jgi:hypothetical protein
VLLDKILLDVVAPETSAVAVSGGGFIVKIPLSVREGSAAAGITHQWGSLFTVASYTGSAFPTKTMRVLPP